MTLYTLALFLHVLGALVLGAANALLLAGLIQARRASTVEELRLWSGLALGTGRMTLPAALLLLVPGIYLVFAAWGWATPWIDVSLGVLVILALLGRFALGPRLAALRMDALHAASGPISHALHRQRADRALWTAAWMSTALILGVVFLMTNKPDLVGTLATIAVAIVAGAALPIVLRPSAARPAAPSQVPAGAGLDGES
jgi:Predicted integral membrane protein (DUF2269)